MRIVASKFLASVFCDILFCSVFWHFIFELYWGEQMDFKDHHCTHVTSTSPQPEQREKSQNSEKRGKVPIVFKSLSNSCILYNLK